MISLLKDWKGGVEIQNKRYRTIDGIPADLDLSGPIRINLFPEKRSQENGMVNGKNGHSKEAENSEVVITVKQYMTKTSSPKFDFMAKWNNDVPMPLRTMVGHKVKETPGMVFMELHGDILAEKTVHCMCCGKRLTNPVSQYFGIGPECGHHNYVNPFDTDEELKAAVSSYRKQLQEIKWSGWIIKSAITEEVPYEK